MSANIPPQLRRLPREGLLPLRDGVAALVEVGFQQIEDVPGLHDVLVQKLKPPASETLPTIQPEADEELPEPPENLAEIITGQNPELPFIRFDTTAVPKELEAGAEIYLRSNLNNLALAPDGDILTAAGEELSCVFAMERLDGGDTGTFADGDEVLLRIVDSGAYLTCRTDNKALTIEDRDAESQAQEFALFKKSRPKGVKSGQTIFLRSWLGNYLGQEPNGKIVANRWVRKLEQELTVLKKAVVESATTDLARKMQFQAFDTDGSGTVSKAELAQMCDMLALDSDIDELFGTLDPDGDGKIDLARFKAWADEGGMDPSSLNHAEVLGNFAQRCNDALFVEKALNEVLSLVPSTMIHQISEIYSQRFGADLSKDVEEKGKDGDGWIFSSYWKTALCALVEPEVNLWARALNDAMRGLGTDEGTLTALVCTLPERLREQIFARYEEAYGKKLVNHIKSETSCAYKKVLVLQAMSPEACKARMLNQAMDGLGTDESQLIRVLSLCDFGERRALKETYAEVFKRGLIQHIESETSGHLKDALTCMLNAEEEECDIDADCEKLMTAMEGAAAAKPPEEKKGGWFSGAYGAVSGAIAGMGTDEKTLIEVICARTPKQMEDINKKFEETYEKKLFDKVKGETSGHLQAVLLGCINHPMKQLAHSVRACIKGWGTDDSGLICCIVHLEEFKREALYKTYMDEFGRDLLKDIKNDTSGNYQKALLSLVRPAPAVWADALRGAMKGLGTSDELLINFMAIAKDNMREVREAFALRNGKSVAEWIEGDCSGDYKKTLVAIASRNSDDLVDMLPIYWAQRLRDALVNSDTLKDVLVTLPGVAIKRGTQVFQEVYGEPLREKIAQVCDDKKSWFSFSNYWKVTMLSLMDMPVERYVKGLNDAMAGIGTDEYALTGLVCTMPANLYPAIHGLYEKTYGKTLVDHIDSETSFAYKKVLIYQALSWPQSRAKALNGAMAGLGTSENQLIRVIVSTTPPERMRIREAYMEMYHKDLIEHVESETSGSFKKILKALLKTTEYQPEPNYTQDCEQLKAAMDGRGTDEGAIIKILAGKDDRQIQWLRERYDKMFGEPSLYDRLDSETSDWGTSIFTGDSFRQAVLALLRPPLERLACAVRDCIKGWGTDDTGLITCLVHLSEAKRAQLVEAYKFIKDGGDMLEHVRGDTSGDFQQALLALIRPAPVVLSEALVSAMKGLGTSDELLINWMCIGKDRMDEVRAAFEEQQGKTLAEWIEGDCSGDYKDTLVKLSKRKCYKFVGNDTGLTLPAPPSRKKALERFNKTFNEFCRKKKDCPDDALSLPEYAQQEMACAFQFYAMPERSTCSPNMDRTGLWNITNDCGFPPADDAGDLDATFREWDYSGTGEITWNDFVREMTTRVNDPNHYEADPLPEDYEEFDEEWKVPSERTRPEGLDDDYEAREAPEAPGAYECDGVSVPSDVFMGFVAALRGEYVNGEGAMVGDFFDSGVVPGDAQGAFDEAEGAVRDADDKEAALQEFMARWGAA